MDEIQNYKENQSPNVQKWIRHFRYVSLSRHFWRLTQTVVAASDQMKELILKRLVEA